MKKRKTVASESGILTTFDEIHVKSKSPK